MINMRMVSPLRAMVVLTLLVSQSVAENRTFTSTLDATPNFIHYTEGYLVAPGLVDLSGLLFTVMDDGSYDGKSRQKDESFSPAKGKDDDTSYGDDGDTDDGDDKEVLDYDDDSPGDDDEAADDDGRRRVLAGKTRDPSTVIDIVVFREPESCAKTQAGCDWTKLGIGASDETGNLRWCCSKEASEDLQLCRGTSDLGRLIINETLFEGEHRAIVVPATGAHELRVGDATMNMEEQDGNYVMVLSNCNEDGRAVNVTGWYAWKSQGGYLPGDLFGAMYFYFGLVVVYLGILAWYAISMYCYRDAAIPIQRYIALTTLLGFMEVFFKAGDFWVWNEDGTRFWFAMYVGVMLGVAKRALSRVLVMMVSLGWGVVRDTLGDAMNKIVMLGVFYFGASTARDIIAIVAVVDMKTISYEEETELVDIVTILTFLIAAIDVTFYMWILDSLNGTMEYLQNLNQHTKLLRYLRLRMILLFSILFAVAWAVFGLVDTYMDERILLQDSEWAVSGAWELNYLMVLVSVAILWRPNPHAKEYAFVMELPSIGADVEFSTNDGCEEDEEQVRKAQEEVEMAKLHDDLTPPSALKEDETTTATTTTNGKTTNGTEEHVEIS